MHTSHAATTDSPPPLGLGTAAYTVALLSGKGGTGKSTIALAIADVVQERGLAASLIDLDAQAGLTVAAGLEPTRTPLSESPVVAGGLRVYRGGRALAQSSSEALVNHIKRARNGAGMVVLDLSPSLTDAAHVAALGQASVILIIARTDAAGLRNVAECVELGRRAQCPFVVVPSMTQRTALSRDAEAFLRTQYGSDVSATCVPLDAKAAEAAGHGQAVTRTARRSRASIAVRSLVEELFARFDVQDVRLSMGANCPDGVQ